MRRITTLLHCGDSRVIYPRGTKGCASIVDRSSPRQRWKRSEIGMLKDKNALLVRFRSKRDISLSDGASEPRVRNCLFIALLSTVIVVLAFESVSQLSEGTRMEALRNSGGIAMTSGELVHHVRNEKIVAYWLGPITGYKYSIICKDRREIIVTYIPRGVSLNHPDRFNLTIETYSKSLLSESSKFSTVTSDRDDFLASNGTTASIYSERPVMVTFGITSTDSRVEVQYPSGARIHDMYADAERLTLISKL